MKYYKQTQNDEVQMLMEVLEEQAQENPDWTLQKLFALCRDIPFLVDDSRNADYSDSTYLILAELFSEFRRYGQLLDVPDALRSVRSFTMDEASKQEMISALSDLRSGVIEGRARMLTAQWEKEGTLRAWEQHVEDLSAEMMDVTPEESPAALDEVEPTRRDCPKRKKQRGRKRIVLLLGCALLLLALGLIIYQNAYALYRYLPATDEDVCVNANGVMVNKEDGQLFSGRLRSCSEGGSLSVYSYKEGLLDGLDVVYYEGDVKEVGHWKEGKQNGLFLLYSTSGILLDEANFKNGERHGRTRQFAPESGKLLVEGSYNNGLMDGEWTQYYPDAGCVAMVQTFEKGVLNGPAKQYYEHGQLQIDMNYVDDLPNGPYKSYYPDGTLQVEGALENGFYSKDTKLYAEDGTQLDVSFGEETDGDWDSEPSGDEITITEVPSDAELPVLD